MFCKKNEFLVRDKATEKFPSTFWSGDLYECADCGAQIVTGFGKPMSKGLAHGTPLEFTRD
jgi:hypothetical protein